MIFFVVALIAAVLSFGVLQEPRPESLRSLVALLILAILSLIVGRRPVA